MEPLSREPRAPVVAEIAPPARASSPMVQPVPLVYNNNMFRVVPSVDEDAQIREVTSDAAGGRRVAIRYSSDHGRGPWFQALTTRLLALQPTAVVVRVPNDPDRIERTILELAAACGTACLAEVACRLRSEADELTSTLAALEHGLGDRRIIMDGWSALQVTDETYDAGHAVDARFKQVHAWLTNHAWVVTDREWLPRGFSWHRVNAPVHSPSVLENGATHARADLWERFAPDVGVYNASLALLALQGDPDADVAPPAWKVRDHVVHELPDDARDLLFVLAVHGRALPDDVQPAFDRDGGATKLLVSLGMCERSTSGCVADPGWVRWCADELGDQARRYHARLADEFAKRVEPEDKAADRAGLSVLEAHRHYVAIADDERARRFARYGCGLLVEEGKRRSLRGRYEEAARLYDSVLGLADGGALALARRLRGYVRHYAHFNRAKAAMESLAETERGYRASVEEWPENALFWSRLVRTQVYARKGAVALTTLCEADKIVPEHDEKEPVLYARTVRGLIQPAHRGEYLVEAAWVWGDYQPTTSQARWVAEKLRRLLAEGWSTRELALPGADRLVFSRAQMVRVTCSADQWIGELPELQCRGRGATPRAALESLLEEVRRETRMLVSTFTHALEAALRLRKQILLGAIDLVASGLDATGSDRVWVMGQLVREDDGAIGLRTQGSRDLWFELSPELAASAVPSATVYLAEVMAGPSGVPVGPVTQLVEAQGTPATIWEEWRRRMGGDD